MLFALKSYSSFCCVQQELSPSSLASCLLYTGLFHVTEITHCLKATKMLQKQQGRNKIAKRSQKLWPAEKHTSCQWGLEETIITSVCSFAKGETETKVWEPEMQRLGYLHILVMGKDTSKLLEQFVCIRLSKIRHHVHKPKREIWKAQQRCAFGAKEWAKEAP